MTTFLGWPPLLKAAVFGVDLFNPLESVIIFQYNPDTVSHALQPKVAGRGVP